MSKIKAHVAISLDGYIAHTDGETNWIPGELAKEISEIHQASEILLAGSNSYNAIFEQCGGSWPYKNTYIVSHYDRSALASENLQYLFDEPIEKICEMKKAATGDITVIDGGNLITSLLNPTFTLKIIFHKNSPIFWRYLFTNSLKFNSSISLNCLKIEL